MNQDDLHRTLTRQMKQCPEWFDVCALTMMHDLYKPMTGTAKMMAEVFNAFGGMRDASEYLTLEGHLQMWCDANGWEWWYDPERDYFRFGKLVSKKMHRGKVKVQCFCGGVGLGLMIHDDLREPRIKEKGLDVSEKIETPPAPLAL